MSHKVLLVDDDEVAHIIGKRLISVSRFAKEAIHVNNGKEALAFFYNILGKEENIEKYIIPDIILLDINMPIMNGWEFLDEFFKKLSSKFPFVKIAIVSSSMDPADLEKSKKSPLVLDYILKPLTVEKLKNLDVILKKYALPKPENGRII